MRHVRGNFGLGDLGLVRPVEAVGLVADRDAFDASYFGAGASLTFGDSWDPSANVI